MTTRRFIAALYGAGLLSLEAGAQAPRFLVTPTDTTQPPIVVDTSRLPMLRQRVALSVDGASAADALRSLMRASRLDFVFDNAVVANARPARIGSDSMTVATALMRLLEGAGVDILMRSSTTLVVMPAVTRVATASNAGPVIRADRISGRVVDSTGRAVAAASVVTTMAPNRDVFTATTDSAGRFLIDVLHGTGDYLVYIAAVGKRPVRRRVTREGMEPLPVVNATLLGELAQLDVVNVRSARTVPARLAEQPTTGVAGDQLVEGIGGVIAPDAYGDLAAIASTLPAFLVSGGVGSQNQFSFSGLMMLGADMPRDLPVHIRVATTPFDPTLGWFTGGSVSMAPVRNGTYRTTTGRLTTTGSNTAAGGRPVRGFDAGFSTDGPVDFIRRWRATAAGQLGRTWSATTSLFDASPTVLAEAGISPDSVARLQTVLAARQIPLSASASRYTDAGTVLLDIGRNIQSDSGSIVGLVIGAGGSRSRGLGLSARGASSTSAATSAASGSIAATMSKYLTRYHLLELRSGLSVQHQSTTPAVHVPSARVRIASDLPDGTEDIADAVVGGSSLDRRATQRVRWQNSGELSFSLNRDPRHRLKLRGEAVIEQAHRTTHDLGSFAFSSIGALNDGMPDHYTRVLGNRDANGGVWNAALSLRDQFVLKPGVSLTWGARLEAAGFTAAPPAVAAADQRFGIRTGWIPGSVHISPRIGFNWRLQPIPASFISSDIGLFRPIASFLRGGIGEFRGITTSETLLDAMAAANGGQTLSCVGAAAPAPDWAAYQANEAAIPTACPAGSNATFADVAPTVRAFASRYAPPRSWKANLNYRTRTAVAGFAIDATYALNLDQPSTIERNLMTTPAFVTSEGRWVFAPATAIVPGTGAIARSAARVDGTFGSVLEHRSDLRSAIRAITFELTPNNRGYAGSVQLSYTLSALTADTRSRNGTAFEAADLVTRGRDAADVRHRFQLLFATALGAGVSVSGNARLNSGRPYTPMVSGDVNGDGLANDRAFVDPSAATLLSGAPSHARTCIAASSGHAASPNACTGPWSASLDGRIRINRGELQKRRITSIDISLNNVLAGLDGLVNGSRVRGWGETGAVDPVLSYVRGFDPAAQRFIYEPNPAFGRTRALSRVTNPFRLTVDVRLMLSPSNRVQQFRTTILRGRNGWPGRALTREELRTRFAARVPDPYQAMYPLADSMLLSRQQVDSLRKLQAAYQKRVGAVWDELTDYVTGLPTSFNENALFEHQQEVVMRAWTLAWRTVHEDLAPMLTPIQLTMLPSSWVAPLYRATAPNPAWPTMM